MQIVIMLYRNHYNVVGLDKIAAYLEKKEKIPAKTIAITIDDGFEDNYKYAYPVLKRYWIPATIFVIVNKIGQPGWLTWDEIKEMSGSGVVTIGSHTLSHRWLPSLNDLDLKEELTGSKRAFEEKLSKPCDFLCYPIGAHDERVKRAAKDAGYKAVCGTNPGRLKSSGDIYAIKRIRISDSSDSLFIFWGETTGLYTFLKENRSKRRNAERLAASMSEAALSK